jgi:hypothetical protein
MEKYDRAVREFDAPDLEHLLRAARRPDIERQLDAEAP